MARDRGTWFRCFADVPGVGYPGDPQRRARLPERNAVPEVHEFNFDGERRISLSWPSPEGSTSASPVHRLGFGDFRNESSGHARERVLTALELPGEIPDYHFAMQGVAEFLNKRRRSEPGHLPFVEWLYAYDARLVEAHEAAFRLTPEKSEYVNVLAFDFLIDINRREGRLSDALAFARRFARFRAERDTVSELEARVAQMSAEHE